MRRGRYTVLQLNRPKYPRLQCAFERTDYGLCDALSNGTYPWWKLTNMKPV